MATSTYKSLGSIKRGDTFAFYIDLVSNGSPVTGAVDKMRSQVRNSSDKLLAELAIRELDDVPGRYLFQSPIDNGGTSVWSGTVLLDIEYTEDEIVRSTETLSLVVEKDITHD